MEKTFITIHNLLPEANILFTSDSILDILGYHPSNVLGKSCFDYFYPKEVPFARSVHRKGVLLDKAAALYYMRIRSRDGQWVSCECCFTVVHDVLLSCTSIYRRSEKSERRAIEAPQIRRLFSSSPRDLRYHMMEHLSPKFPMPPMEREPRAALILNRFTRTLAIMFATDTLVSILGLRPDQLHGKSFYECIAEACLPDTIKCLESAKTNDSIAYFRFWYRDPRRERDFEDEEGDGDEGRNEPDGSAQPVQLGTVHDGNAGRKMKCEPMDPSSLRNQAILQAHIQPSSSPNTSLSANGNQVHQAPVTDRSSSGARALPPSLTQLRQRECPNVDPQTRNRQHRRELIPTYELEAIVSCTSDGLVVVLRKALPEIWAPISCCNMT